MSDEPDKSEKTEDPSQHKLDEAHKKGDVAKSQEVTTWFMILGATLMFALGAPVTAKNLMQQLGLVLANADRYDLSGGGLSVLAGGLASTVLITIMLPLSTLTMFAIVANMIQHRLVWSAEPLKPKASKVSLIKGAQRLFSGEALVNFAKGLIKLGVVGGAMFIAMWGERDRLDDMISEDPWLILATFQEMALKLFVYTLAIVTVIAIADFLYQRNKWWDKQKMTVKEVRDEHKSMEGDPQIKARIRQLRSDKSRKRMMSSVPDSTVVITNPTHFAVALKYDRQMAAPKCVAKGADAIALRIRLMAKDNDVPIVENPPLARALYASVEVDQTVPEEHFQAVAKVIGYVMQLRKKTAWQA